jgi:sugar/nucleoside kinase (ribokinase family)
MDTNQGKFKLGTADTTLLAVGTLAIDYICTSQYEIVEVPPGGKKQFSTMEALEKKIARYGIKKGKYYPGSSIGNFLNQVQLLTFIDPSHASTYLATALALKDPSSEILLKSLDDFHVQYSITEFNEEDAANPVSLLIESKNYTKILSFKDIRFPAIQVNDPPTGTPGVVIIGAAAGHTVQSKQNALDYARERNLPVGMITTIGEINEFEKDKALKKVTEDILEYASFFSCNEDEAKKILYNLKPDIKPSNDRVVLVQQLRETLGNDKLDILLSFGSEGSLVLAGNTVFKQRIPDTPHSQIVSAVGAGDTLSAAFIQGVRNKGMDAAGICWTLPRANRAAQKVLKVEDTRTGQSTAEEFLKEPSSEYEVEVIKI